MEEVFSGQEKVGKESEPFTRLRGRMLSDPAAQTRWRQ